MSDKLFISFKRTSSDGGTSRHSYLINQLMKMYGNIDVIDENEKTEIVNLKTAKEYLASNIYDYLQNMLPDDEYNKFLQVYSVMTDRDKKETEEIIQAALYENHVDKISKAVAKAIYGMNLKNSVSRLETFAECAYKHFISYGLALMPRKEYEVETADIGNIYHKSIELFSKRITDSKVSWDKLDSTLRDEMINTAVDEAIKGYSDTALTDTYRNMYEIDRIRRMSKKTIWALSEQLKAGKFVPEDFELRFSSDFGLDDLKYYYDDGSQMSLRGVIDRVDYFSAGDDIYIKIIDYKSGKKKFEINDVYNGLALQLVLYMEAATIMAKKKYPGKNIVPAGLFYYNIDDPIIDEKDVDNLNIEKIKCNNTDDNSSKEVEELKRIINNKVLKMLKPEGIVNDSQTSMNAFDTEIDKVMELGSESNVIPVVFNKNGSFALRSKTVSENDFDALMKFVHEKIREIGKDILDGNIALNPYKKVGADGGKANSCACIYCEYKTVCGFDKRVAGCEYRNLYKLKNNEVWEKIRKEGVNNNGKVD